MSGIAASEHGSQDRPLMPSGRCPNHGTHARVVITGGQGDALQCRVSTCCAAFAEQIVETVEG